MLKIQNTCSDPATPACRKCREILDPRREEDILDEFGVFVRLLCTASGCGHEDWYSNLVIVEAPAFASPTLTQTNPEDPGEVWIHDVMLGLSFRVETGSNHGEPIKSNP
ncbi:MAG TPA: hypothetical protein VN223_05725 [Candidatus Elarobacter sp.]|nr:hypothetical protein [Candidatus Elarobacter sp.]